ncbi:MAG: hypothetical protein WAV07_13220 [Candidatus Contendobacter sp.]
MAVGAALLPSAAAGLFNCLQVQAGFVGGAGLGIVLDGLLLRRGQPNILPGAVDDESTFLGLPFLGSTHETEKTVR